MQDLKDQGLQNDGNPPEPSQQNLEGDNFPGPSQDATGQDQNQQSHDNLPAQDDRGVPVENVLSEVRKKMDRLLERMDNFEMRQPQNLNQSNDFQQPYQQNQTQSQRLQQHNIPRTPAEIANTVIREAKEKYGEDLSNVNYWELQAFQTQRAAELNSLMIRNMSSTQAERNQSEARIKNSYPDLSNPRSPLAQNVLSEINRRASLMNTTPQALYEQDPYIFESVTPLVASQLNISPKLQNKVPINRLGGNNLPPKNFEGKQTMQGEEPKLSHEEKAFATRYGIKDETVAMVKEKMQIRNNKAEIIDDGSGLLS